MELTTLAFAVQALEILPGLIQAGVNVASFIKSTNDALAKMKAENRNPTKEEWDAQNAVIADLRAQLRS